MIVLLSERNSSIVYIFYLIKNLFACLAGVLAIHRRECKPLICPNYQDLLGPWPSKLPVCANNGHTYGHVHQVRCLKDFLPSLEVKHEGGCSLLEVRRSLGRNLKHKACAESRRGFEMNPICLSNNITYKNPFQAICDRPSLFIF